LVVGLSFGGDGSGPRHLADGAELGQDAFMLLIVVVPVLWELDRTRTGDSVHLGGGWKLWAGEDRRSVFWFELKNIGGW